MEKKILLAVDGSIHSTHAVQYAVRMSSVVKELTYTLFFVQPTFSQYLIDEAETSLKAKAELKKLIRENARKAREILEDHKTRMVSMGIAEKRIDVDTRPKVLGIAKDILDYGQQGLFDAILVGRRGLSKLQQCFISSAAANLVQHSTLIPVWVVDGAVTSNKLMLAVDGSEASLRALDHLCFMTGGNEKIRVTLFHVKPMVGNYCVIDFNENGAEAHKIVARGAKQCIDHFYARAQKLFAGAGFKEKQIELKVVRRAMDVGKAIATEAKKGDYGTVIVGRRGINEAFFMGTVSKQVLDKVCARALWVVP